MVSTPRTVIFIGRSGSGKGTQGRLLENYLSREEGEFPVLYIESGARFRSFVTGGSPTADISRRVQERGDLQPSFLSIWVWSDILIESFSGKEHLILDGVPRKESEALVLAEALRFYERVRPLVVFLEVSDSIARSRLTARGRHDDGEEETIRTRMSWYESDVVPALEALRADPSLTFVTIDGARPIEDIHEEIIRNVTSA